MLPFVQNIFVRVKLSPKEYRNVSDCCRALEALGFFVVGLVACWTEKSNVWRCLSTIDVLVRVLFGMSVNVADCLVRMLLGMSGNSPAAGSRIRLHENITAAPGKFTLRMSPQFVTREDRMCCNRH